MNRVKFKMMVVVSVGEIYGSLVRGGKKTRGADATTLGDEWLASVIANGLIWLILGVEFLVWFVRLLLVW